MLSVEVIAALAQVAAWVVAGLMAVLFVSYDYRRRDEPDPELEELERRIEATRRQL